MAIATHFFCNMHFKVKLFFCGISMNNSLDHGKVGVIYQNSYFD